VIVSLVQKMHGSRILYLGPEGQLVREVHLDFTVRPSRTSAFHRLLGLR
jgi:hypothetical protein